MGLTQGLLVADTAQLKLRGTAYGVFNLASGLAMLVASIVAGALWDDYGPVATFLAGAAFTTAAFIGLFALQKRFAAGGAKTVREQWP
jgi:MFS family permease